MATPGQGVVSPRSRGDRAVPLNQKGGGGGGGGGGVLLSLKVVLDGYRRHSTKGSFESDGIPSVNVKVFSA